jgi:hypothetical protein
MEKQGLEAIPAELLRAKERLRFNSEKLGYIDVEREGPFEIQDDEPSQQPAISVEQPSDVHRPVPQTPRGPPEGSRTPIPRTPLPQTPQIQRAATQTPIVPTATQQQQQTTTIPQPQPVTPPSQHNNQPTTEDQPLEIQDETTTRPPLYLPEHDHKTDQDHHHQPQHHQPDYHNKIPLSHHQTQHNKQQPRRSR